jgi:hypothetical protein
MPHAQTKSNTSSSPPNIEDFLGALNPPGLLWHQRINVEGAFAHAVELAEGDVGKGEVRLAIEDGSLVEAHNRLTNAGYTLEWTTDLHHEILPSAPHPNRPGTLLETIQKAKSANAGREIDSVLIGQRSAGNRQFFVQVTFLDSTWTGQPPTEFDEHDHDEE